MSQATVQQNEKDYICNYPVKYSLPDLSGPAVAL